MAKPKIVSPASGAMIPVLEKHPDIPALSHNVLVTTAGLINGQSEHAGIITQVLDDGSVNVTVFPGAGQPYPITSIRHVDDDRAGPLHWRYPPQP